MKAFRPSPNVLSYAMALLTVFACNDDHARQDTSIAGSFESVVVVEVDERVLFDPKGTPFAIKVVSIEDSRCPVDVVCIWEGMAKVQFAITSISHPFDLYLGGGDGYPNSTTCMFEGRTYRLTLADVTPYPAKSNSHEPKKAHFEVREVD